METETIQPKRLQCDMEKECAGCITHIDDSGFIYCARHGERRKAWKRCRKLRPHEIKRLEAGKTVTRY